LDGLLITPNGDADYADFVWRDAGTKYPVSLNEAHGV
jgi:hypothetical protein